jgi:large subunit ribosomal protein L6
MSRIGRLPIQIPTGVDVAINGNVVTVKGPNGTLTKEFHKDMIIKSEDGVITVTRPSEDKMHKSLHGLTRTLVSNMVDGVTKGFSKELEINGVGYRAAKQGNKVVMNLGFSHQVEVSEVPGIKIDVLTPNKLKISGPDKQQVGQFAAEMREKRPPEPYKGKGIKYVDEVIRRKEGKAGKGAKGTK